MEEVSFEHRLKKAKTGFRQKAESRSFREVAEEKGKMLNKVNKGKKKIGAYGGGYILLGRRKFIQKSKTTFWNSP